LQANKSPGEVIVVENGSTDSTWTVLESLDKKSFCFSLVTTRSEKGLGNAIREGLRHVTQHHVVITADDLPFGFSDVEEYISSELDFEIAIGSKAHPNSSLNRTVSRTAMSSVFRVLRHRIIGVNLGDTQGTILGKSEIVCSLGLMTSQTGYLMSTELLAHAVAENRRIIELPVVLRPSQRSSNVRIIRDSWLMLLGLFEVRRSLRLKK
jgi:glycosyltransferase involved in cell wall biosynthesis